MTVIEFLSNGYEKKISLEKLISFIFLSNYHRKYNTTDNDIIQKYDYISYNIEIIQKYRTQIIIQIAGWCILVKMIYSLIIIVSLFTKKSKKNNNNIALV